MYIEMWKCESDRIELYFSYLSILFPTFHSFPLLYKSFPYFSQLSPTFRNFPYFSQILPILYNFPLFEMLNILKIEVLTYMEHGHGICTVSLLTS